MPDALAAYRKDDGIAFHVLPPRNWLAPLWPYVKVGFAALVGFAACLMLLMVTGS